MKIVYQKETVLFSSLVCGTVFVYENKVFIKYCELEGLGFNCFCFDSNSHWCVQSVSLVVPMYESELIVK